MPNLSPQTLDVCIRGLNSGVIREEFRSKVLAFLTSDDTDSTEPQLLVKAGILTQDQLDKLLAETTAYSGEKDAREPDAPRGGSADGGTSAEEFILRIGDGRYEVLEEIGRGAMGIVYRAHDRNLDRTVAIKVLPEGKLAGEDKLQRFYREAKSAARLAHPNVVPIHDVVLTEDLPYFTMQYIAGENLSARLKRGPLDVAQAVEVFLKVARAIGAGHKLGIIHRDIKPGNIILDAEGEPHVTDFGIAKDIRAALDLTGRGHVMGTYGYMSPEQLEGRSHEADARSDIFSLGATLYHMVTGQPPFPDPRARVGDARVSPPRQLCPSLPPMLEAAILRALEPDRHSRYPTVAEMAADVERTRVGAPVAQPVPTRTIEFCIEHGDITTFKADVVALKHARAVPLSAHLAVARALAWAGVDFGELSPSPGSSSIVDTGGRISAKQALFVGVDRDEVLVYDRMGSFGSRVLEAIHEKVPLASHLAMPLHGLGYGLDEVEVLRSQCAGMLTGASQGSVPPHLKRITIVEGNPNRVERLRVAFDEYVSGLRRAVPLGTCWGYAIELPCTEVRAHQADGFPHGSGGKESGLRPTALVGLRLNRETEDLFHYGIQQAVRSRGCICERVDPDSTGEEALIWTKKRVDACRVLIADISDAPPFLYVLLGYSWARAKRTILLLHKSKEPPFDLRKIECVTYESIRELEKGLSEQLRGL